MSSTVAGSPVQGGPSQQLVTLLSGGSMALINTYLFTYRRAKVNEFGQQGHLLKVSSGSIPPQQLVMLYHH